MKQTNQNSTQLRQDAEARLVRTQLTLVQPQPGEDLLHELLHELQVHQIELEMQNEQLRQAQTTLEESRDRYVDLYEFAPVGYLTLTDTGMISEINLTGATLIGEERGKLLQRNFKYFIASKDSERWGRYFVNVVQRGLAGSCELALKRGDGHHFPAQLDCLRMQTDSKATVRIALTDISKRKQAEEELRIAAIAFETQEAMMVTDISGGIVRVNRAFTQLTGYSAEELVGETPALFKSGRHDQPFLRQMWATLALERYWQGEIWNRHKDGNIYATWLTISAVTAPDGHISHYVATYSDINRDSEAESVVPTI